ncbi:MAG: hypothetical protein M1834_002788 [Cirrosporium novae-zelandiae]|nr:MAG: hypothetical protein M1834_002788 [Cirrosporium novae-zelandiae]
MAAEHYYNISSSSSLPSTNSGDGGGGSHPQYFPNRAQFSGFMKPCRFEGEVLNLEVEEGGRIPSELDGAFLRVMPDPQFPPFVEDDPWFNGDGNISAFRIAEGKVSFRQRFVRTEKFVREREGGKALMGKYRNKFTDAVEFKVRSTANTNIAYFNGVLLAMKEDCPPYALNPETLETIGLWDFNKQLPSLTFTAHPKFDPFTKEMVCFGYEAKGDGTPDVCYYSVSPDGKFNETVWLVAPVVAMIHDFAVTENWVLFPLIPQVCDIERMKRGGEHWEWNPDIPFYIGLLPRHRAKGSDVKWFRAPNAFPGHTCNAYETADGKIVFDLAKGDNNVFFWWPDAQGRSPEPENIKTVLTRLTIDPHATNIELAPGQVLKDCNMEFPRIDDRFSMRHYSHCFFDVMDPNLRTDFEKIMPSMGGGYPVYNALGHIHIETEEYETYFPGSTHFVQEPVFVPRSASAGEGDGFLMALVNNYASMLSELHIIDTKDFAKARAIVKLPVRLRPGLHGNWVDSQQMKMNI